MSFKRIFLFIISVVFTLVACEKGTEDEIPSYISIDKFDLTTDPSVEGSSKLPNIKDAWVYIDNELIGTFELPASIPILKSGSHTLRVDAGILVNGISSTRAPYPFYTSYVKQIELTKKETFKITPDPKITYYPNTVFKWKENFETGVSIDSINGSNTHMQRCTDSTIVYEGDGCGAIYLDSAHPIFGGVTSSRFQLPKGGNYVFLELNFRTDNELNVGILASSSSNPETYIVLNDTKGVWKKIYINLTGKISNHPEAENFKIFFSAYKNESLSTASIFIDNIKLVHF